MNNEQKYKKEKWREDYDREQRIAELEEVVRLSIQYLKEGHAKFTPNVTNSLVLDLIEKAIAMLGDNNE